VLGFNKKKIDKQEGDKGTVNKESD
jgi:hypothetical protein